MENYDWYYQYHKTVLFEKTTGIVLFEIDHCDGLFIVGLVKFVSLEKAQDYILKRFIDTTNNSRSPTTETIRRS